jgi:hypothetical protein
VPEAEPASISRLKEIAETRMHHGYRRVHMLLRREGWSLGQNGTCRI